MADITMCNGEGCPVKERCHRFTAEPSESQSYFATPPIDNGLCEFYWGESNEYIYTQLKDILNGNQES